MIGAVDYVSFERHQNIYDLGAFNDIGIGFEAKILFCDLLISLFSRSRRRFVKLNETFLAFQLRQQKFNDLCDRWHVL